MESPKQNGKHIGKTLLVYLGSAWVFIEAFNFTIDHYNLDSKYLDIIVLLVIFGLPATVIYEWFEHRFTKKAIALHTINAALAVGVIGLDMYNPDRMHPTELRLFNFKKNQKELAQSIRSIAVLPFANYTGNTEKDFLSAGVHDALISKMGQVGAIRVISKTSTLAYANSSKSIQTVASELDVDAIIEGSMIQAGDSISLQLKLIHAFPKETQLWTQVFKAAQTDLLNVYGSMTKNIVEEINVALTPEEDALLSKKGEVDPRAYEAYLKGKYSMGLLSKEGIEAAMGYFQQAIEFDPEFAAAYGGLGGIWAFLKQMDFVSADVANPIITENISKALKLDSTLADVYYWDGVKKIWTDFDWRSGEQSFKKALELNPNFAEVRGFYSNFLMAEGRWKESEDQMAKALKTDPNNPLINVLHGMLYMLEEKFDSCILLYEPMQKNMPQNPLLNLGLFVSYSKTGNTEKAVEQVKIKLDLEGHNVAIALFEENYNNAGYTNALLTTAQALEAQDSAFLVAQSMQYYYALAGNEDKAMDWVEKGFIRKDPDMYVIAIHPVLKPFRDNARYKEIAKRMNLPLNQYYTDIVN